MDDRLSFRENALMRAREVVGDNSIELSDDNPTILFDMIQRDGKEEQILLIHYRASIANEEKLGNAEWFTFEQIEELDRQ